MLEVAQRSIGSVLREAEPLVTLVPVAAPVEAEVSIAARDIGQVAAGDTVRVKLDAFPFQKHGTAGGLVRTLSADAFQRGRGGWRGGLPGADVLDRHRFVRGAGALPADPGHDRGGGDLRSASGECCRISCTPCCAASMTAFGNPDPREEPILSDPNLFQQR